MKKELDLMTKLNFDELIDHSIALYRQHFMFLVKIMAYFYVPGIVIMVFIAGKSISFYSEMMRQVSTQPQNADMPAMFSNLGSVFGYTFGLLAIFFLLNMLASAATIRGIDDRLSGRKSDEGEVAIFTLKKAVPLILTSVIATIMMGVGFIFCIIPGFVLAVYLLYATQVIMIEGRWGFGAVGRSFSSVDGNFWSSLLIVLLYYLAFMFIASLISYAPMLPAYIRMMGQIVKSGGQADPEIMARFYSDNSLMIIIQYVLWHVVQLLMSPILNIALTLKFLNIRNLKEGTSLLHDINKENQGAR